MKTFCATSMHQTLHAVHCRVIKNLWELAEYYIILDFLALSIFIYMNMGNAMKRRKYYKQAIANITLQQLPFLIITGKMPCTATKPQSRSWQLLHMHLYSCKRIKRSEWLQKKNIK